MLSGVALLAALVITHCPAIEVGVCATTAIIEAHNTVRWGVVEPGWACDGSVWWVATLDGADPVTIRCMVISTPWADSLVYCPDSIAPVKYWDRPAGVSAWLGYRACNAAGCSPECVIELVWPSYLCYNCGEWNGKAYGERNGIRKNR